MLVPMLRIARRAVAVAALGMGIVACGAGADTSPTVERPVVDDRSATTGPSTTEAGATTTAPARAAATVRLARVGTFASPLYVTGAPGDRRRLFVVEQGGRIMIVRGGRKLARPFLDIRSLVTSGGEQGLLSVAFPRDYAKTGRFYVHYTDRAAQQRLVEYRRSSADRANHRSARLVLRMADRESNHNGGSLKFGPDGLLYIGTGDGGGAGDRHGARGNAQDLGSLLGKLLRIDPRRSGSRAYRIPTSNPFSGDQGSPTRRGEIYSYGLRNPWRFSFDRATGDLYIGDVGQGDVEEIDFARNGRAKGANFGWRPFEGSRRFAPGESAPGHVPPLIEHSHADGWCSITGGYVVRDRNAPNAIRGLYVYGDFCLGRIYGAGVSESGRSARTRRISGLPKVEDLASFGEDTRGRVYVVSLSGSVSRLAAG